jgi:hypothetical protein
VPVPAEFTAIACAFHRASHLAKWRHISLHRKGDGFGRGIAILQVNQAARPRVCSHHGGADLRFLRRETG